MRKATRLVELDDILSSNYYGEANISLIDSVLRGHLALEAIIVEMIQLRIAGNRAWKMAFPKKTGFLKKEGILSQNDKKAFDLMNELRNDFAHSFVYAITIEYILALARELEGLGGDFSDSVGHYAPADAIAYYDGIPGVLAEVWWCVLFEASQILEEHGGRAIQ